jgi:hypothetical protein
VRKTIYFGLILALTFGSMRLLAQDDNGKSPATPQRFYHLLFTVEEVGDSGKIINSRVYTTSASEHNYQQIRTGTRVPIKTNDKGEVQYIDIGVNIDCKNVHEVDGKLSAEITADISSVASKVETPNLMPIVRQNRWTATVLVPLGKPRVIFSSDNLQDKGKLQVELTATRLD